MHFEKESLCLCGKQTMTQCCRTFALNMSSRRCKKMWHDVQGCSVRPRLTSYMLTHRLLGQKTQHTTHILHPSVIWLKILMDCLGPTPLPIMQCQLQHCVCRYWFAHKITVQNSRQNFNAVHKPAQAHNTILRLMLICLNL